MSSGNQIEVCQDKGLMIQVKNAWKCYSASQYILRDLSISVPRGKIYSLLGSSGVGKTTLLKGIVGNILLDSGSIHVNVNSRLEIGYMPQELALYPELSLIEIFQFFGLIVNMTRMEIDKRVEELSRLLQLPPSKTQLSSLSGGQQRRVSVAVAMLKNPDLLILDEPTANLDPLLKQKIWLYFQNISRDEEKTILVTTHYIEEAKNSDKVGFLASGRILFEGSPEEALRYTNPQSERLEDVYYQLCSQDLLKNEESIQPPQKKISSTPEVFLKFNRLSFRRIIAVLLKSLFYIRRNILIFYVFISSPAILIILLTMVMARPRGIRIGYVNHEDNCTTNYTNCSTPLSCRYLENLREKEINLINFDSVDEGKEAVKRNNVWGMVRFNWNFSDGVVNRLDYFYASEHVEVAEDDEAKVWLDMSAYPVSYMLKKHFYDSFLKSLEEWYSDCGWNARAVHPIFRMEEPVFGKIDETFLSTAIPTLQPITLIFTGVALGLIFVLSDKELGIFNRCRVSGLKTMELIVSAFLLCFTSLALVSLVLLILMYVYTGPSNGPFLWLAIIYLLQTATGVLVGILIGLTTDNLATALQLSTGIMPLLTYLSGMTWPIETAHWLGRAIHNIIPSFIPTDAVTVMAIKGLVLDKLLWALSHSILWILIILLLIVLTARKIEPR